MKRLLLFPAVLLAFLPNAALAITLNLTYPKFGTLDLNNLPQGKELSTLIAWFYTAIVTISGIAAFVMIVWGGVQWMVSAGNPSKTSEAANRIRQAVLGLLIVLASFILLQIINPDFTVLQNPL